MDKKMTKAEIKRRRETMLKARRDDERYAGIIAHRVAHGMPIHPDEMERYRDIEAATIAATIAYNTATDLYWDRLRSDWADNERAQRAEQIAGA